MPLIPISVSSAETILDLVAHERSIAVIKVDLSLSNKRVLLDSIQSKKSTSAIRPYLIISAIPEENCLSDNVPNTSTSIKTAAGW